MCGALQKKAIRNWHGERYFAANKYIVTQPAQRIYMRTVRDVERLSAQAMQMLAMERVAQRARATHGAAADHQGLPAGIAMMPYAFNMHPAVAARQARVVSQATVSSSARIKVPKRHDWMLAQRNNLHRMKKRKYPMNQINSFLFFLFLAISSPSLGQTRSENPIDESIPTSSTLKVIDSRTSSVEELAQAFGIDFDAKLPSSECQSYLTKRVRVHEAPLSFIALDAQMKLGFLYRGHGLEDDARSEFRKVIVLADRIMSESPNMDVKEKSFWVRAVAHKQIGEFDAGLEALDRFYHEYPFSQHYLPAKRIEIEILVQQGKYDAALKECDYIAGNYPRCRMRPEDYQDYMQKVQSGETRPFDSEGKVAACEGRVKTFLAMGNAEKAKKVLEDLSRIDSSFAKNKLKYLTKQIDDFQTENVGRNGR